jgi:hypothetical protein
MVRANFRVKPTSMSIPEDLSYTQPVVVGLGRTPQESQMVTLGQNAPRGI